MSSANDKKQETSMFRLTTLAAVGLVSLSAAAYAAPELVRVRGTIESATDTAVTVKTSDGKTQAIQLASGTAFVNVVKSSLDKVDEGKFIGTATKGENPPTALEVVIFPEEMKGTGEGHYAWDEIADTTAGSGTMAKSSMTNGTVKTPAAGGMKTKSSMTNGTVKTGSSASGGKTIEVTYDGGQSKTVLVPPSAPIVAFEKADKSILMKGAPLFAVTAKDGDALSGKLVAVGKDGVVPPM